MFEVLEYPQWFGAKASNFSFTFQMWCSKLQFYMFNLQIALMIEEWHWLWKDSKENREKDQERKRFGDKACSVSHLHFSYQNKPDDLSQVIPSVDKRSPWTISIVFGSCLLMSYFTQALEMACFYHLWDFADFCRQGGIHQELTVPVDSDVYLHIFFAWFPKWINGLVIMLISVIWSYEYLLPWSLENVEIETLLIYLCTAVFKSVEFTPLVSFSQFSVETL